MPETPYGRASPLSRLFLIPRFNKLRLTKETVTGSPDAQAKPPFFFNKAGWQKGHLYFIIRPLYKEAGIIMPKNFFNVSALKITYDGFLLSTFNQKLGDFL